ncbi:serine hydrolase-domain-containing protein [Aspergillus aurantiobrunneus]
MYKVDIEGESTHYFLLLPQITSGSQSSMPTRTTDRVPGMPGPTVSHGLGLHLPRILCLHGGGTNARIFRNQCRSLLEQLKPHFRLVFADAPFYAGPGPDVESVYAQWGPFRSWVRPTAGVMPVTWGPVSLDVDAIDRAIRTAVEADNSAGATGSVVGLLGFSQGAKMAGCLLLRQQEEHSRQKKANEEGETMLQLGLFAVLIAGRGPLNALDDDDARQTPLPLRLPTIHVHGLRDPNLAMHRDLLHRDCVKGTAQVIEWDGDHRVPIKTKDVARVVAAICNVARETGIELGFSEGTGCLDTV